MWTWGNNGGMMPPYGMPIYVVPTPEQPRTNTGRSNRRSNNFNKPKMNSHKSLRKQLKEARKNAEAWTEHADWLKREQDKLKPKEDKKDDKNSLTFMQKAASLFLFANICIGMEIFIISTFLHK